MLSVSSETAVFINITRLLECEVGIVTLRSISLLLSL